jgi:hypothetical protein
MKRVVFVGVVFVIGIACSFTLPQRVCIEIKDRQHLPKEIYEDLKDYKTVLIGEMHGTNESPQYTEGIVNLWLNAGQKVILGIEMYGLEQGRIDSFLITGDFSIIEKMPFFNQHMQYGTSSKAMANLIKSCYKKNNLKIICLDITDYRKTDNKDSMMAVCINNTLRLNPGYEIITLTGNIHNKLDSNQFGKPMGYWLYKIPASLLKRNEIASIEVVFDSGSAWCCQPDCGVHNESEKIPWIRDKCNYDSFFRMYENGAMYFYTKTITASLPLNP